jgi:uncharacterized membrane protein
MKKRILKHLQHMDDILAELEQGKIPETQNLQEIYENHMNQITFFMHERLIHLIVTVLFAIGTFMTIFTFILSNQVGLLALAFLLLVLLVPYISHYYLLENGVQKMYEQYDALLKYMKRL